MHPTAIDYSVDGELAITWQDSTRSRIPTMLLRRRCPCASCRSAASSGRIPLLGSSAVAIRDVILVGSSAIRVIWEDGHFAGIYRYTMLRTLAASSSQD